VDSRVSGQVCEQCSCLGPLVGNVVMAEEGWPMSDRLTVNLTSQNQENARCVGSAKTFPLTDLVGGPGPDVTTQWASVIAAACRT
jgi:hypothetical protein